MKNKFKLLYKKLFFSKNELTSSLKKNIIALFVIRGLNIVTGLLLIPMTIHYLNPTKYGIWITLSSIIAWFGFFDIGLGNGLRNKFTEAIAAKDFKLAKTYVSTTYLLLTIVIGVLLSFAYIINPYINWNSLLNVSSDVNIQESLNTVFLVIFAFFCLRFVLKLLTTILVAAQNPAKASLFDLFGNIIALLFIFILTQNTKDSILYVGIVFTASPVVVLILGSFWYYTKDYRAFKPSLKFVDFSKSKVLLNLGVKFFIIQIAAILLYQTNNIIISHLFGPQEVTPYNIAFNYFNIITMTFSIILTPFWSAFTEAWVKKDLDWIKNSMRKLKKIWLAFSVLCFFMYLISDWLYTVWIGESIKVPNIMSAFVAMWVIINAWNSIYSSFLNGIGKITLQLYVGLSIAILNVPLAIFLGKHFGITGVLMANVILGLFAIVLYPIQYKNIILKTAKGVFNK